MKNQQVCASSSGGRTLLQRALALAGTALLGVTALQASTDFPPAVWAPPCKANYYTSGSGHKFQVTHDIEGYYASTISRFRSCSFSAASIHYVVNGKKDASSDAAAGACTQMIRDTHYAWHARCWNRHSTGTEHEGFVSNPAWYTEAQYVTSASITRHLQSRFGWAMDRNHVIGHDQKRISGWPSYASSHLGIDPYCNSHTDPGTRWNWTHYMDLCKNTLSTPSAPSALKATAFSASQINLAWTDNSGIETGFKIERSTSATTGFAQIATAAANIKAYNNTGLASGTTYYYRVRAYNASGNSAYSNTANAATKDTIPAAPTALTATAASDVQINLAWAQAMANEDGFRIYRSTDNVTYTLVATVGINVVSYSNTGLTGNRLYYYKVAAYNTAGNSAYSNVASDTTAPQAPSGLVVAAVAGTTNWNRLQLTWTDTSNAEVGFKVERGTAAAGPFTQIGTTTAGVASYQDSGLAPTTTYYYRVRSYNANGNSAYSAVVSKATGNAPPVLGVIGNRTIAAGTALAFTATASDPNAPAAVTAWTGTFEGTADGTQEQMFRKPINSGTTTSFIDTTATNYSTVKTGIPAGLGGTKGVKFGWSFKTGMSDVWVRLTTAGAPTFPNIAIALDQKLQFKMHGSHTYNIGIGVRESGTTAAYGADGGTTGSIEWVGVTNSTGGIPLPSKAVAINTATTISWNIPFEPQLAFTGDGLVDQSGAKGTLEHIIVKATSAGAGGANVLWVDDISVITANTLVYSLDAGAPAGATIGRRNGKFSWTPTVAQAGAFNITARVTDNLGAQDFETFVVTVTSAGVNNAPVLSAIGNQTVSEGSALAFTATATDANGNALTYSLDAGNPSGSSITTGGAFSWTPTEAQGPGSYPITVRVTDNGAPASNDFETITVTVNEANNAPVVAAIANQTINQGASLSLTASATDSDTPAQTLTYSIAGPAGMTINPSSGAISWTSGPVDANQTYQVTVTATDSGVPALKGTKTFTVSITSVNNAPVVSLGTKAISDTIAAFDELDDESIEGHNNAVMFRVPYFSGSTTSYLDSTSYSLLTNDFPRDDVNGTYQALFVQPNFKTGTVNPWVRLTTFVSTTLPTWTNSYAYPNPTIELNKHVRFRIWSDKSVKVGLGVRETGTLNPPGLEGGSTGPIEWLGCTTVTNAGVVSPVPSRTITASNWVLVDFDLPNEVIRAFPASGNGVLASGKGVLEHLAIVPNGGTGIYKIYVDEFEQTSSSTGTTVTINTGDTLTVPVTATDIDLPGQSITYSLGAGAPTNAVIDDTSGVFTWTPVPEQSSTTNVIQMVATDSGVPALSGTANLTVIVNKANTPPHIAKIEDLIVEDGSGAVAFDVVAEDDDLPGDTITYTIQSGPSGATLSSSTGAFSWTPPAGVSTNQFIFRATDNGVPALYDEVAVTIIVVPVNTAPTLLLGTARATEKVFTFETFTNNTPNEAVLFKKPGNSATTTNFVDLTATNYTSVTTSFPAGNANAGAKTLKIGWTFKTGTANYWVRLTTGNTTLLPNPTINASARLKFDVYTTKALKVGLGIRETGTTAENGANGGTTGTIEYVGVSSLVSGAPIPTRTVNASNWTTLEFDLPSEPAQAFTGNGVLTGGQQVLEHLILAGAGGTGAYTVYVDNFSVVTTTALPGTVSLKANSTLTFTAGGTDPDPGAGLSFGLDPDFADANPTATLDSATGAFSWTPTATSSQTLGVTVQDDPTNGSVSKSTTGSFTVNVVADALAAQGGEGTFVAGGETVALEWSSLAGSSYLIQSKEKGGSWSDVGTVTATGGASSVSVSNRGNDATYRIVEAVTGASNE